MEGNGNSNGNGSGDEGDDEMRARLAKYLQAKKGLDAENHVLSKKDAVLRRSRNTKDAIPMATIQTANDRVKRPWGSVSSISDSKSAKVSRISEGQVKPNASSYPNLISRGMMRPNTLEKHRKHILYRRVHQDPSFKPPIDPNNIELAHLLNLTPKQILQHRSATEELAVNLHNLVDTIEGKMGRLLGYHHQVIKERRPIIPEDEFLSLNFDGQFEKCIRRAQEVLESLTTNSKKETPLSEWAHLKNKLDSLSKLFSCKWQETDIANNIILLNKL